MAPEGVARKVLGGWYIGGMGSVDEKCADGPGGDCRLPELTGLQYLVVGILFGGEMTSEELRGELVRRVGPRSGASFWRLMMRMSKASIVDFTHPSDRSADWKGQKYVERQYRYQVTDLGVVLWKKAREFYLGMEPPPADFEAGETLAVEFAEYGPQQRKEMEQGLFMDAFRDALGVESLE